MAKKKRQPTVGGTAISGSKSTQVKKLPETNDAQELQYSSYNRDMRRRMQNMGTAPESQKASNPALDRRKKALEKKEKKQKEIRESVSKQVPKSAVAVGRRGLIFPLVVFLILAILIVGFIILRATGVLPS